MCTGRQLNYLFNFYNIILLVGFGDYYPITLPGRFIAFILCIWGVFVVSLIILILTFLLKLNIF